MRWRTRVSVAALSRCVRLVGGLIQVELWLFLPLPACRLPLDSKSTAARNDLRSPVNRRSARLFA